MISSKTKTVLFLSLLLVTQSFSRAILEIGETAPGVEEEHKAAHVESVVHSEHANIETSATGEEHHDNVIAEPPLVSSHTETEPKHTEHVKVELEPVAKEVHLTHEFAHSPVEHHDHETSIGTEHTVHEVAHSPVEHHESPFAAEIVHNPESPAASEHTVHEVAHSPVENHESLAATEVHSTHEIVHAPIEHHGTPEHTVHEVAHSPVEHHESPVAAEVHLAHEVVHNLESPSATEHTVQEVAHAPVENHVVHSPVEHHESPVAEEADVHTVHEAVHTPVEHHASHADSAVVAPSEQSETPNHSDTNEGPIAHIQLVAIEHPTHDEHTANAGKIVVDEKPSSQPCASKSDVKDMDELFKIRFFVKSGIISSIIAD